MNPSSTIYADPFLPVAAEEIVEVISNCTVNSEYRSLEVSCSALASRGSPGQFYQLACPAPPGEELFLRRPMSLYISDPQRLRISFLYKISGTGTRGLALLGKGDKMRLLGPLGHGFQLNPDWHHIVAIGRGAGLATLGPLAHAGQKAGMSVTAILSARRPDLVVSEALFRAQGARVIIITDSEGTSGPAHVERILRDLIAERRCDALFTCGSSRLLRVQQLLADEFKLPGQVAMEQQMACGLGMCFSCVRDFNVSGKIVQKRVCWDGPVFDILEALP